MEAALVIVRKEWTELRRQPALVLALVVPTVVLAVAPWVALPLLADADARVAAEIDVPLDILRVPGLDIAGSLQTLIAGQLSSLFLLLPVLVTSVTAAASVAGEKLARTLEPLLATPVRTWELLLGKTLATALPGIVAAWAAALSFVAAVVALTPPAVAAAVLSPGRVVILAVWIPLLALLAVALTVAVSSRVNDVRAAQSAAALLVLPVVAVTIGPLVGISFTGTGVTLAIGVGLAALTAGAGALAVAVFGREAILTRWR